MLPLGSDENMSAVSAEKGSSTPHVTEQQRGTSPDLSPSSCPGLGKEGAGVGSVWRPQPPNLKICSRGISGPCLPELTRMAPGLYMKCHSCTACLPP